TAGAPAFHLTAINSTIWVADNTDPAPTTLPDAFFDSLDLRLSNSFLVFNHPATIRAACIDLDGNSELNDRWSTAGQLKIIATDSSHIGLTGNNWKKATFHIH
ncbi:MAG TPA: hypothetical protein VHE54_10875, partial [Puia sp.]|nr:hypothetical protein [Puia sp.]